MSEREKRNRNKGAADFLFQLTENQHVSKRDTNPSLLNWKSTGEMRHTFDDGASQMSSAGPMFEDGQSTHLRCQSVSCLYFTCYIETIVKSTQCTWQRVQLRLAATWESYTRSMSRERPGGKRPQTDRLFPGLRPPLLCSRG